MKPVEATCLPVSTNSDACDVQLLHKEGSLRVHYGYQHTDGSMDYCDIVFCNAIYFQVWDEVTKRILDMPNSFCSMYKIEGSDILDAAVQNHTTRVGHLPWEVAAGGPSRFAHYAIQFDHGILLEVISERYEISCVLAKG